MPVIERIEHPSRIIICVIEGDWIEWKHDRSPEEGDCPFGDCDCTPTLYVRATDAR